MKLGFGSKFLITLAAVVGVYGCHLDGNVVGFIWRGTALLELALLLIVAAVLLPAPFYVRRKLLIGASVVGVLIFVGAQHFARAARRNAMTSGEIPANSVENITADEIRERFALCFPNALDEFHELELGRVPPLPNHSVPRWMLTQAYAPMNGVPRGFGVACAYLKFKYESAGTAGFIRDVTALGLNPQPFLEAATAVESASLPTSTSPSAMERIQTDRVLKIPEGSASVLTYPSHPVPEIDDATLQHPGAIVIDPADLRSMSYGWEWVWLSRQRPRVGLHTREGAGDYEGQEGGVGDFHGLHRNTDKSEVVYDFNVATPGYYALQALILPEATKCSNYPQASLDDDGIYADLGHNDCVPYAWYTADWRGGARILSAGAHQLHLHFMQDGMTIAQFWLTPRGQRNSGVAVVPFDERPPLVLMLTRRSMAILANDTVDFGAWVENAGQLKGTAAIDAELDPGRGREHLKVHADVKLDPEHAIQEIPLSLTLPEKCPAREMRVTVTLSKPDEGFSVVRESTVVKPFPALLLGPIARPHDKDLSIIDAEYVPPKDEDFRRDTPPTESAWGRFPANAISYYGLYDLNRAFGGSSQDGIFFSRAYVAVKLDVPKDGRYLLKIMGDDVVKLWIDGRHLYSSERKGPPIRYPGVATAALTAGEHVMVMHVDQTTGWWQCGVHLRTEDDDVCDIEGVAP